MYSKQSFPLLLVVGLFARLGTIGVLAIALTIQIFVYPEAWSPHLSWAAILLPLIARGGGAWSFDVFPGIERATFRIPVALAAA